MTTAPDPTSSRLVSLTVSTMPVESYQPVLVVTRSGVTWCKVGIDDTSMTNALTRVYDIERSLGLGHRVREVHQHTTNALLDGTEDLDFAVACQKLKVKQHANETREAFGTRAMQLIMARQAQTPRPVVFNTKSLLTSRHYGSNNTKNVKKTPLRMHFRAVTQDTKRKEPQLNVSMCFSLITRLSQTLPLWRVAAANPDGYTHIFHPDIDNFKVDTTAVFVSGLVIGNNIAEMPPVLDHLHVLYFSKVLEIWNAESLSKWTKCTYCSKIEPRMPKCGDCGVAVYCSITCQQRHWHSHKPSCRRVCQLKNLATPLLVQPDNAVGLCVSFKLCGATSTTKPRAEPRAEPRAAQAHD